MWLTWILASSIFIFSISANCQSLGPFTTSTEDLLEYYQNILPESYIKRIKSLKIEGLGSKRMEEFEALLNSKNNPFDMISCLQDTYQSISLTELQDLLGRTKQYLSDHAKRLKCQATKAVIKESEMKMIYSELRSNKLFNNNFPAGNCFDRAYLVSKELDSKGIKSSQFLINDHVVAAYRTDNRYKAESYPVHIANIVQVDVNGKVVEYVFDPIYFDSPLTLTEYKKKVLINANTPYVMKLSQDFHEKKQTSNECSYNDFELEVAKQNILSSQAKKTKNQCPEGTCFETQDLAIQNFKKKYF